MGSENVYCSAASFKRIKSAVPEIETVKNIHPEPPYVSAVLGMQIVASELIPDDQFIVCSQAGFIFYKALRKSGLSHDEACDKFKKSDDHK